MKPFSVISYNSEKYLRDTLQYYNCEYAYFVHPEFHTDISEGKKHIHLGIFPTGKFSFKDLYDDLKQETDEKGTFLGLAPTKQTINDLGAWYLYGLHDKEYLDSVNASPKPYYDLQPGEVFYCSSEPLRDQLTRAGAEISSNPLSFRKVAAAYFRGTSVAQYCYENNISINHVQAVQRCYEALTFSGADAPSDLQSQNVPDPLEDIPDTYESETRSDPDGIDESPAIMIDPQLPAVDKKIFKEVSTNGQLQIENPPFHIRR